MAFIFHASKSISSLSLKVAICIHETWEPSCGQNHELFLWLLPQICCSQPSFKLILGILIEKCFNPLKKKIYIVSLLFVEVTSLTPYSPGNAVHISFPRLRNCLTSCLLLHLSALHTPPPTLLSFVGSSFSALI